MVVVASTLTVVALGTAKGMSAAPTDPVDAPGLLPPINTVPPPACPPDHFQSSVLDPGTGMGFKFDRLGVRVPAILISPWIPKNTVVDRVFDHASIPATVTKFFLGAYSARSPREINADVFIEPQVDPVDPARNLLSLEIMRTDCPEFEPQD